MNCLNCNSKDTDGRSFCRPSCYVEFKDGKRGGQEGISTFVRRVKGRPGEATFFL